MLVGLAAVARLAARGVRVRTRNLMILLLGFSLVGVFAYAQLWGGVFLGL